MNGRSLKEEDLVRLFQRCISPSELESEVEEIQWEIENHVSIMWEEMISKNVVRLAGITTELGGEICAFLPDETRQYVRYEILPYPLVGTDYNYELFFVVGDFNFYCPITINDEDLRFPEPIIDWIDRQRLVLRNVIPAYLTAKGKIQRKYEVQRTALEARMNALLQKHCMGARIKISEDVSHCFPMWHMDLSMDTKTEDTVSLGFRYRYYPLYKRGLSRMMESLFCFFGRSYWQSLTYKNPDPFNHYVFNHYVFKQYVEKYVDENTGKIETKVLFPDAPAHTCPFHDEFCRTFPDMQLMMSPMDDSSGNNVIILIKPAYWSRAYYAVYFMFDFQRYDLGDFMKVIRLLNRDLLTPLKQIGKTGNYAKLSILIDFEKALGSLE